MTVLSILNEKGTDVCTVQAGQKVSEIAQNAPAAENWCRSCRWTFRRRYRRDFRARSCACRG